MDQKHAIFPCFVLAALAAVPTLKASPLVSIGDSADLFFSGSTSMLWTSNLYRDEDNEESDLIWSVTPGFELNVGRGVSNVDLSILTQYEFRRYQENDEQDVELFSISAVGSYRGSRLDLSASAGFSEQKSTTGEEAGIFSDQMIETDNWNARVDGEYRFSPKLSVGSGFHYSEKEYKPILGLDWFSDRSTVKIPVDGFYELTPKVDLSVGYEYSETDVDASDFRPAYTTEDHFFNVGARGNLLPKLTGFFKVGYRVRELDNGANDDSTLGLDADLTWAATPKLTTRLGLTRDFGVGGEGESTENTGFDLNVSYSINSYLAANASGSYTNRDYAGGREDDQYRIGTGLTYTPNQYWSFGAGYAYSENDSNLVDRSYVDHSFNISASLRY
jgi:hypothetical protein